MTPPDVAGLVVGASLRGPTVRGGRYHELDAREACCWLGAEARLGEQPRVLRLGAPAARKDGEQPDVQVLREVRWVVVGFDRLD